MRLDNKKATYNYEILDTIEAGIVLTGEEVKSLRAHSIDFTGSYVSINAQEAYLINLHIGVADESMSRRTRKLLLHKKEILSIKEKKESKNLVIVPLSVYTSGTHIKVEIALAKGKKEFAKRETKKNRDIERDIERELRDMR